MGMSKLVVLTDLGTFKAFRMDEDKKFSSPRLEPLETVENELADERLRLLVTDQAGDFGQGSAASAAMSVGATGERHNIWLENERRSVKEIVHRLSELLQDREVDSCYFAASNEINRSIIEALPREARAKIKKNVHANLVNARREEVLSQFASQ